MFSVRYIYHGRRMTVYLAIVVVVFGPLCLMAFIRTLAKRFLFPAAGFGAAANRRIRKFYFSSSGSLALNSASNRDACTGREVLREGLLPDGRD